MVGWDVFDGTDLGVGVDEAAVETSPSRSRVNLSTSVVSQHVESIG